MKNCKPYSDPIQADYQEYYDAPIGLLLIRATQSGLRSITVVSNEDSNTHINAYTELTKTQLSAYFKGQLQKVDVPLDWSGYSGFYQKVWQELLTIPYGQTISYTDLAIRTGNLKAIRAVGTANGRNRIPVIVPCHRVIGRNGALTGYALGLHVKQQLLELENPEKFVWLTPLI